MEYANNYYIVIERGVPFDDEREMLLREYRKTVCFSEYLGSEPGEEYRRVGVLPSRFEDFRRAAHAVDIDIYEDPRFEDRVW
jgi:hypothetical protein